MWTTVNTYDLWLSVVVMGELYRATNTIPKYGRYIRASQVKSFEDRGCTTIYFYDGTQINIDEKFDDFAKRFFKYSKET
jgi:hypothetical protein